MAIIWVISLLYIIYTYFQSPILATIYLVIWIVLVSIWWKHASISLARYNLRRYENSTKRLKVLSNRTGTSVNWKEREEKTAELRKKLEDLEKLFS